MNTKCYRVIFNKVRGQYVAVSEAAASSGKAWTGDTEPGQVEDGSGIHPEANLGKHIIALACWLLAAGVPQYAMAQIIADPNAPANQRATVLLDSAGRPLVNIQTPSAAGVSRNTYSQFDVQANGIVLNNSRASNPWLATGEAKVILNEVNSSNPSYLGGAITVNGQRAQVVIANPSGIKVDGASFVNASRATITTGVPVVVNGDLSGLNVQQGTVEVAGKGLNVNGVSYTDILSRAATFTGPVTTRSEVSVTTGAQTVDYITGQLTPNAGTGIKPTLAIDTAALGGMYAGRITLLATEAGVGVRNAGTLQATGGELIITADGRLQNSGTMDAAITSIATVSGNIDNNGVLLGRKVLLASSGADINLAGSGMSQGVDSPSAVIVQAKGSVNLASGVQIASNGNAIEADGSVTSGTVSINASGNINLAQASSINAHGKVELLSDGAIAATGVAVNSTTADVTVVAKQGLTLTSSQMVGKRIQLETGAPFVETKSNISINGSTLTGSDQISMFSSGDLSLYNASVNSGGGAHLESANSVGIQLSSLNTVGFTNILGAGVNLMGAQIQANGVDAGINITATQSGLNISDEYPYWKGYFLQATEITTTGNLRISSVLGDISAQALQAKANNISIIGGGNTTITSSYYNFDNCYCDQQYVGSALTSTNNLTLASVGQGKSLTVMGSAVQSTLGDVWLASAGGIYIGNSSNRWDVTYTTWTSSITAGTSIGLSSADTLLWDVWAGGSRFKAGTDLSITAGAGNLSLSAANQSQLQAGRDFSLVAKAGTVTLQGSNGTSIGGSTKVKLSGLRDINLQGTSVDLQGSQLSASRNIALTSTVGDVTIGALTNNVLEGGYNNIYTDHANLNASGAINVTAAQDILAKGLSAWSPSITLQSARDITITGTSSRVDHFDGNTGYWHFTSGGNNDWVSRKRTTNLSYITGYNGVNVTAGRNIDLTSVGLSAGSGIANIQAIGDVTLGATQDWAAYSATSSGRSCGGFLGLFCDDWTYYYLREYLTTRPTNISARDIQVRAGNNVTTQASVLNAYPQYAWNGLNYIPSGGKIEILAGNQANYYAVKDIYQANDTYNSSSSFIGIEYSDDRTVNNYLASTPTVTQLQSTGTFQSYSGGDQTFQGTKVNASGGYDIRAGVGETARADARIYLQGVQSTIETSKTRESNYVLWQKMSGSGGTTSTMALPSFVGGGSFQAPGGIEVQLPAGELKSQIQALVSQPGMAYLNDLALRKDVNWQPVKLAYDKWDYSHEGLTPAGAALVAVVVAWATGGAGASLIGSIGTTTTVVGGVATTSFTTAGLIANAALTSLASQASITLINNKGDIGKTLSDMANSSTVKATVAAALTAGVLDKIGGTAGMQDLSKSTAFSDKLTYNLINASGRALTNTAINGGSLEDTLKSAIISGIVDTAHGAVASQIKGLEADYIAHKLAHALAGCVAGAAAGGACQDGAIGAAVGEMVAGMFDKPANGASRETWDAYNSKVLAYSKLVAGGVAAYSGGNAQTAITTSEIAVQNNYLSKPQLTALQTELNNCKANQCSEAQVNAILDRYVKQSQANDAALATCTTSACVETHRVALQDAAATSASTMWLIGNSNGNTQLINELIGRETKTSTLLYQQSRVEKIEAARKALDQYVSSNCQGLSQAACSSQLQASQAFANTLTEVFAGFTPAGIAVDIKDLLQAQTMGDYSLAVLGIVLPGVGDGVKALMKGGAVTGEVAITLKQLALPTSKPGLLVPNAMSAAEAAQAADIIAFKGGKFVGQLTSNTPGIDGWLNGVPVSLKEVTGNGMTAVQRNIVDGTKQMVNAKQVGDMYIDAARTGITVQDVTDWVKPGTPISNILSEGAVNNINIKTANGWVTLTCSTLKTPGAL